MRSLSMPLTGGRNQEKGQECEVWVVFCIRSLPCRVGWGQLGTPGQDRDSPGRCMRGRRGGTRTEPQEYPALPSSHIWQLPPCSRRLQSLDCCSSPRFLGEERSMRSCLEPSLLLQLPGDRKGLSPCPVQFWPGDREAKQLLLTLALHPLGARDGFKREVSSSCGDSQDTAARCCKHPDGNRRQTRPGAHGQAE